MLDNPRLRPPGGKGALAWLRHYRRAWLAGDLTAGVVVSVMIIPQSMAYAMLAGLPSRSGSMRASCLCSAMRCSAAA